MLKVLLTTLFLTAGIAIAQEQPPIRALENAEGTVVDKLWLFLHQGGFRFSPATEVSRRPDVNFDDKAVLIYREDDRKKELGFACLLTFENIPPGTGSIRKEHVVSRLTFFCKVSGAGEESESFEVSADAIEIGTEDDEEEEFEEFTFRGIRCTPHIRFSALKDLPGDDYSFTLSGFWIAFDFPD